MKESQAMSHGKQQPAAGTGLPSSAHALLTKRQVSGLLQLSTRTIDRFVAAGRLPAIKLSRNIIRFRASDLAAFTAAGSTCAFFVPKSGQQKAGVR
jgi:excisionase family DNA binding protein